jgi:hypothetical protein
MYVGDRGLLWNLLLYLGGGIVVGSFAGYCVGVRKGATSESPGSDSPQKRGSGRLGIISARYGAPGHYEDVKRFLESRVSGDRLDMTANSQSLGGDAAKGEIKQLIVEYEYGGEKHSKSIGEGQPFTLP